LVIHTNNSHETAVELREVSKNYPGSPPVNALSKVSISVRAGEFVGIIGASGSGKTTLLHIIGTLTSPSEGSVFINGINTKQMSDGQLSGLRSKHIGFVFQEFFLLPGFTATENVENGLLYSGTSRKERTEKSRAMLDKVGLSKRWNHQPNELSGGEQQRVAIARALVNEPSFILADEPTGNVDSKNTSSLMDLFFDLNSDGTTVILITHDSDVAAVSKRNLTLVDGRIESDIQLKPRYPNG
jgi:putative ABC transport system ATP-binding protein